MSFDSWRQLNCICTSMKNPAVNSQAVQAHSKLSDIERQSAHDQQFQHWPRTTTNQQKCFKWQSKTQKKSVWWHQLSQLGISLPYNRTSCHSCSKLRYHVHTYPETTSITPVDMTQLLQPCRWLFWSGLGLVWPWQMSWSIFHHWMTFNQRQNTMFVSSFVGTYIFS